MAGGRDRYTEIKKELIELINRNSIENYCDMPDFLLAEMTMAFWFNCGGYIKKNLDWHGCDSICHPKNNQRRTEFNQLREGGRE